MLLNKLKNGHECRVLVKYIEEKLFNAVGYILVSCH